MFSSPCSCKILHWCKVNVFKVIVLLGTFALAMAFAGNDLVNFVGVPLAGFSSYTDFMANGNGVANDYLMGALNEPAKTPFIFLFLSGVIMVISLITSKKAQNVIKYLLSIFRVRMMETRCSVLRLLHGVWYVR